MSDTPVKVINRFKYDCGEIFELKFCTVPSTSSKKNRYQWVLINHGDRFDLKVINVTENIRTFEFNDPLYESMVWTVQLDTDKMKLLMTHNKNPYLESPIIYQYNIL